MPRSARDPAGFWVAQRIGSAVGARLESGRFAWGCFAALALVSIVVIGFEARGVQISWRRMGVLEPACPGPSERAVRPAPRRAI